MGGIRNCPDASSFKGSYMSFKTKQQAINYIKSEWSNYLYKGDDGVLRIKHTGEPVADTAIQCDLCKRWGVSPILEGDEHLIHYVADDICRHKDTGESDMDVCESCEEDFELLDEVE